MGRCGKSARVRCRDCRYFEEEKMDSETSYVGAPYQRCTCPSAARWDPVEGWILLNGSKPSELWDPSHLNQAGDCPWFRSLARFVVGSLEEAVGRPGSEDVYFPKGDDEDED